MYSEAIDRLLKDENGSPLLKKVLEKEKKRLEEGSGAEAHPADEVKAFTQSLFWRLEKRSEALKKGSEEMKKGSEEMKKGSEELKGSEEMKGSEEGTANNKETANNKQTANNKGTANTTSKGTPHTESLNPDNKSKKEEIIVPTRLLTNG